MSQIPNQTDPRELIRQALNWRYAVKRFDSTKKISPEDWSVLADSLLMAPSSYGLQPWKFLIVQKPEIRKQLTALSWNQPQIEECSHLVVFTNYKSMDEAHVKKYIQKISEVRGVPIEQLAGYQNMMIGDVVKGPRAAVIRPWAQRQAYIAMGFLLETAGLLKVDACPLEGLDPAGYDKVLGLTGTNFETVAAVALGYRSEADQTSTNKKVRFSPNDVIEFL